MTASFAIMCCRIIIALVFALSAGGKSLDLSSFQVAIRDFNLLPARWTKIASWLLLGLELTVVLLMLMDRLLLIGFGLSIVSLTLFATALMITLRRNMSVTCNCFGRTERKVSVYEVWRNVVLIVVGLLGMWLSFYATTRDLKTTEILLATVMASYVVTLVVNLGDVIQTLLRPFQID